MTGVKRQQISSDILYDVMKAEEKNNIDAIEELKHKLTTLNHFMYNFDVLECNYLTEERTPTEGTSRMITWPLCQTLLYAKNCIRLFIFFAFCAKP